MICKTSEVAACCSNDSLNCRSSHAIFVLWSAVALRRLPVFGVLAALGATVLRLRALVGLLPALERRRIASPKGSGVRRPSFTGTQLQQGFTTDEMGSDDQFALQKS
jgi:hypothetical protein